MNKKLPQFAIPEHIRCNTHLPIGQQLPELEERLVFKIIAFSQIRKCEYKHVQMGLMGSIINVLVNMDIIQKALPQCINETTTIAISLKR